MKHWIKSCVVYLWYLVACLIIVAAIIGVTLQALTPVINHHKAYVEKKISDVLHVDVTIRRIRADWVRFGPEIHFIGLTLRDSTAGNDAPIFHADDFSIRLGVFGTLWHRAPYFSSITVSGSKINVREVGANHYLVNDAIALDMSDASPSHAPEFFAWLITQNTIRLSHLTLVLQQLNGNAISIALDHANVYQSHAGAEHKKLSVFIDGDVSAKIGQAGSDVKKIQTELTLYTWIDLHKGMPVFVESELLSQNVLLQQDNSTHIYPSIEGVFLWQPLSQGSDNWVLQGKNIVLTRATKQQDDYQFEFWRLSDHYAAHLNALDLQDVSTAVDFFDISPPSFNIKDANIHGMLEDITVEIPKNLSAIDQYKFSTAFYGLSSHPYQELPEIHHASGAISGGLKQGIFTIFDKNDVLFFPLYFNQPVAVKNLLAHGQWNNSQDTFSLLLDSIKVVTPDVSAQGALQLDVPADQSSSAMLNLLAEYHLLHTQAITQLLPMKKFDADFSDWLTHAIKSGEGADGKVLIRGSVDDFPYANNQGVFIVDAAIKPSVISFSPEWPSVDNISGNLLLHNQKFDMSIVGNTLQASINSAKVSVDNYSADHVVVKVDASVDGSVADYQQYMDKSPLHSTLSQWLQPFKITGRGALSLHVDLPLGQLDAEHIAVSGQWLAQRASFIWTAFGVGVTNVQGALHFTQNSLSAQGVEGVLSGESVKININTELMKNVMTAIHVDTTGEFSPLQLHRIFKVDGLDAYMAGKSTYHAHVRIPITTSEYIVNFDSDLHGMAVKLPAPFGKTVQELSPFAMQVSFAPTTNVMRFLINYIKEKIELSVTKMQDRTVWAINMPEAQGSIVIPVSAHTPIHADFDYLTLPQSNKSLNSDKSDLTAKKAATWPELFVNVRACTVGGTHFGEVIFHSSPLTDGVLFNEIKIKNNTYQLATHGQWLSLHNKDQTAFQGSLQAKDTGKFLKEMGITQSLHAKAGSLNYDVTWPGSPLAFQLKMIQGDAQVAVKDGVIPVSGDAAKMGLGKVLTLFSSQSIQRRLQLNFSDLSQNGYSFNTFNSQWHFQSGVAEVSKGGFDGPEAKIDFKGLVDLVKQSYDLRLTVTPYVTSSLPLIATLAGGPIAGVATYAFDKIAASSIAEFTAYHYSLTGPWSQPKLIDLDEQAKQAAAARQAKLDERNVAPVEDAASGRA